jgi:hypothetical protein
MATGGLRLWRGLLLDQFLKRHQLVAAGIRNGPVTEVVIDPMEKLIALATDRFRGFRVTGLNWPDKYVNEVLTPVVNQSGHWSVTKIIESSPRLAEIRRWRG